MEINHETFDYLIGRSGIIGRQILKLCRFVHRKDQEKFHRATGFWGFWLRQRWLQGMLRIPGISRLLDVFYTYYIGGSLTRSDQLTFARLHGMDGDAYRLTLFNAVFCGTPCALGYLLLGEGFSLLKGIHSYAELPSLLAQHASLGIGLSSFTVDIFRAVDACCRRRCWAPFGFMPLVINTPTYLKRLVKGSEPLPETGLRPVSTPARTETGCRTDVHELASCGCGNRSERRPTEDYSKPCRAIPNSR
jgi:hypothetical protein